MSCPYVSTVLWSRFLNSTCRSALARRAVSCFGRPWLDAALCAVHLTGYSDITIDRQSTLPAARQPPPRDIPSAPLPPGSSLTTVRSPRLGNSSALPCRTLVSRALLATTGRSHTYVIAAMLPPECTARKLSRSPACCVSQAHRSVGRNNHISIDGGTDLASPKDDLNASMPAVGDDTD